jgi:hypothetical protein
MDEGTTFDAVHVCACRSSRLMPGWLATFGVELVFVELLTVLGSLRFTGLCSYDGCIDLTIRSLPANVNRTVVPIHP